MSDSEYNIYNHYDPKFINYAELYKSPQEMKLENGSTPEDLISDYGNALMIQNDLQDVYINNADVLVGNRYFINTHTECLDSENKTQTRSVLVDNINKSAMDTTNENRKGLMYSLLASLQLIESETMFDSNVDGPTPYYKQTRNYIKDSDYVPQLPYCKKVAVKTDDQENAVVECGYVLETDVIDPQAVPINGIEQCTDTNTVPKVENFTTREGMIQDTFLESVGNVDEQNPSTTFENIQTGVSDVTVEYEAISESIDEANENALQETGEIAQSGFTMAGQASGDALNNISLESEKAKNSAKGQIDQATQKQNDKVLLRETQRFLEQDDTKMLNTLELFTQLVNMHYICEDGTKLRIPSKCIEGIFQDINVEEIDSIDAKRNDLYYPMDNRVLSFSNFVEETMKTMDSNKNNDSDIPLAGLPSPTIEIRKRERKKGFLGFGGGWRTVKKEEPSADFAHFIENIDPLRTRIAVEIVRYRDVDIYGHCNILNTEGFKTIQSAPVIGPSIIGPSIIGLSIIDFSAFIYIISLLFILFYMIYRFMYRFFDFKGKIKLFSSKKK